MKLVIKKIGSTDGKPNKLGGGGRFAQLAKATSPALAAFIGRKKYGNTGMKKLIMKGKADAKK